MNNRGAVLVATLILVTLACMVAAGLLFRVHAGVMATAATTNGEQAYAAAMSGVNKAIAVLQTSAGDMESWYDNPDVFQTQLVCDEGTNRWYFSVYAHNPSDPDSVRYGLIDEAGKINVNFASEHMLRALPGMTDELVDCLLDYRDRDDDVRPQGAEQDYYDKLSQPYLIKNGPLGTVEELLLIKGFDGSIVFGEDVNLNGLLDENEDDGDESFPPDDSDGQLNLGLRSFLTTFSYDPGLDANGEARIDLNSDDSIDDIGLDSDTVDFIETCRAANVRFFHPSELLEMRYDRGGGDWIEADLDDQELAIVCDRLSGQRVVNEAGQATSPVINVNTAPAEVLATLTGDSAASDIVNRRGSLDSETKATIAWLYTEGVLDADEFKAVAPYLTARSYHYRIQSIGFGIPCGRIRIIEAVIDLARGSPRLRYVRDITRLGAPFALDADSLETSVE